MVGVRRIETVEYSFLRGLCQVLFLRAARQRCRGRSASGSCRNTSALVCALLVIDRHPLIEVSLQCIRRVVELLAERHPVELVQQRLVEPLADAVGLRALHLGPGVVDILDREAELIFVAIVGVSRAVRN